MSEKTYHSTQEMKILDDGTVAITMNVSPDDFMVQWILQWGDKATVVKPKTLIKKLHETGKELLSKYS
jgi:predicted DNA-binding transcriptional regulator YafY